METNKLVAGIVAAAIAIIVLAGVLMPALSNATDTHDTFTNEGYFNMTKYPADADLDISWDYEKSNIVTVNDVEYDLTGIGQGVTVAFAENFGLRIYWNLAGFQLLFPLGTMAATVADNQELDITISSGTVTAVLTTAGEVANTQTVDIDTPVYCISSDGSFVMKKANVPAYMLGDTEFIGLGITSITGAGTKTILVKGTIDDGATATIITTTGTSATLTEPVITDSEVSGYVDLYQLDKITFTGQVSGSADTNITYSYFVVPAEVIAEKAQHLSDPMNAVLNVIPIIIIVAVLLGVVAIFMIRRE